MAEPSIFSTTGSSPLFLQNESVTNYNAKKLIVIQLNGGNDGLNTIVPYRNDIYYNSRPTLGIKKNNVIDIDGDHGFHRSLSGFSDLYKQGYLSVINRVGYPNATRSHFKSMDFWQQGGNFETGWLGRYLDYIGAADDRLAAVEISDVLTRVLRGERAKGVAFDDLEELYYDLANPLVNEAIHLSQTTGIENNANLEYIYNILVSSKALIGSAYEKYNQRPNLDNFPDTDFARQLKLIAEMISCGLETQIFYASLGTFDTHVGQSSKHTRLLKTLSEGLEALVNSLKKTSTFENVCILIFSEFGRRVKENGGKGTDHGAGNSMFIISPHLKKPGFYNDYDALNHLVKGDLPFEIDFRQVYAGILNDWLKVDSQVILKGQFDKLNLFADRITRTVI